MIQINDFGRDHWTLFLQLGIWCEVDGGLIDKTLMRCNGKQHPQYESNFHPSMFPWQDSYSTIIRNGNLVEGHDDWDCLEDHLGAAFVSSVGSPYYPQVQLTALGANVLAGLKVWVTAGCLPAEFIPNQFL